MNRTEQTPDHVEQLDPRSIGLGVVKLFPDELVLGPRQVDGDPVEGLLDARHRLDGVREGGSLRPEAFMYAPKIATLSSRDVLLEPVRESPAAARPPASFAR